MAKARREVTEGRYVHTIEEGAKGEPVAERGLTNAGYRPGRKTARRQGDKPRRKGGDR